MRMILIALMLTACSAYPRIDWPAGPQAGASPALLPQSEILGAGGAADPGSILVARAAALRDWAEPITR